MKKIAKVQKHFVRKPPSRSVCSSSKQRRRVRLCIFAGLPEHLLFEHALTLLTFYV